MKVKLIEKHQHNCWGLTFGKEYEILQVFRDKFSGRCIDYLITNDYKDEVRMLPEDMEQC